MATNIYFTVYRKNDLLISATIQDENENALDLSGASLDFVVETPAGAEKIRKSVGNGITVTDAVNGQIEIDISAADTDIPAGLYKHELLVTDADSNRYTAIVGNFLVLDSLLKDY